MAIPSVTVVSVASSPHHGFSKDIRERIRLLGGLGVEGDAHCGETVKHRSRVAVDPSQPNLRQVHLLDAETLDALNREAFELAPGDLGENVLTSGIDLRALPRGTRLRLGADAVVELTGLRNPCTQIETFRRGLLARVVGKTASGEIERRAGVMAVVVAGGEIRTGDAIAVSLPELPHERLERV